MSMSLHPILNILIIPYILSKDIFNIPRTIYSVGCSFRAIISTDDYEKISMHFRQRFLQYTILIHAYTILLQIFNLIQRIEKKKQVMSSSINIGYINNFRIYI